MVLYILEQLFEWQLIVKNPNYIYFPIFCTVLCHECKILPNSSREYGLKHELSEYNHISSHNDINYYSSCYSSTKISSSEYIYSMNKIIIFIR